MELDSDTLLEQSVRSALIEGMKEKLRYSSAVEKLLTASVGKHELKFRSMVDVDAAKSIKRNEGYRNGVHDSQLRLVRLYMVR